MVEPTNSPRRETQPSLANHKANQIDSDQSIAQPLAISDGGVLPKKDDLPTTLAEILPIAAKISRNRLIYLDRQGKVKTESYLELLEKASKILTRLRQAGLQPQDPVILQLEATDELLAAFWGCILGGFVPVILEMATTQPVREKLHHLWTFLEQPLMISAQSLPYSRILAIDYSVSPTTDYYQPQSDDVAFLNLTSGSTGIPKCIQLTHQNIISRAFGANLHNDHSDDIILNWLPFDHIGSISDWHIRPCLLGCTAVYVQKEYILKRPLNWLDLIHQYRVTHSWSPNFFYALLNDQLKNQSSQWDLSCVRFLLTAGENITQNAIQGCLAQLQPYHLSQTAIRPAFGMAEVGSGITYNTNETEAFKFHVEQGGTFADLGTPIPGITLRIVDEQNHVLREGEIGYLQIKGDAVSKGYYHNTEANQAAFLADGWFKTGDLGLIRTGHLILTGRSSEIIIINGTNYYSHEIEAIVSQVEGVAVSYTAAVAITSDEDATEKLAIFFSSDLENDQTLLNQIRRVLVTHMGINPDYLIQVEKTAIPKTAIGKIQRSELAQRFKTGEFKQNIASVSQKVNPSDIEQDLKRIWQDILQKSDIGLHDNFFELGGTSFLLVQVQQQIQEYLGRSLSIADLFRHPTLLTIKSYLCQPLNIISTKPKKQIIQGDIAVIGLSCRFPGANNIEQFWQNLCNGVESISFFDTTEILKSGVSPELVQNPDYIKASPVLDEIESFDAEFFGFTTKEAELLDPQQRLLLECAYEALEDAHLNPQTYTGEIGIYAGAAMNTYLLNNIHPNRHQLDPNDSLDVTTLDSMGGFQMMVANDKDYLTTRVSYKLNLTGPSINVQTACSTGLAAIHLAAMSLKNGECDVVLAGGVSVQVPQKIGYLYQEGMIVSKDGHCRAFDAQASGTIFGSGCGFVVLKPLETAIQDGDRIYAVLKGSALSNDGGTKVGYLAPNGDGQARAVVQALENAGVDAETITYIEAHGTGTPLGDPIEVAGLSQAFRTHTQKTGYCAIGSVKTNIGHLQIASGMAGFIKTVLALYHQKIPATLHFEKPNPQIDFKQSPFYVNTTLQDWKNEGYPRRAGVNSLGIGGTNVHVILEETPVETRYGVQTRDLASLPILNRPLHLLTLSAKSNTALCNLVKQYQQFLTKNPNLSLADLCFSANTGRPQYSDRIAIIAESVPELQKKLVGVWSPNPEKGYRVNNVPTKIAFLFTGQGSQYINMGRQLYETQPLFRETLNYCAEILQPFLNKSLLDVLYPSSFKQNGHVLPIDQTIYTQPALFAIEYALFKLWQSWGVVPTAVMGHSVGEYVAATVAGVFSLEDGLKLIATRAKLMQALPQDGEMVAVMADESIVKELIYPVTSDIAFAAFNGSQNTVISGTRKTLQKIIDLLAIKGIKTQSLNTSHAFHSPLMEPMIPEFRKVAQEIRYFSPQIDLISNVTGNLITDEIATSEYWCRQITEPVRFADGFKALLQDGYQVFLECGSKPVLLGMGRRILAEMTPDTTQDYLCLPSLSPNSDWEQMLESVAQLYLKGVAIDWMAFDQDYQRCKISLPSYPWHRKRYWIDPPLKTETRRVSSLPPSHPLLGERLPSALKEIIFQSCFSVETLEWFKDHQLYQVPVLPATAYIEIALTAGSKLFKTTHLILENLIIQQPLIFAEHETQTVQVILKKDDKQASFEIYGSLDQENWKLHSFGTVTSYQASLDQTNIDLSQLQQELTSVSVETFYQQCQKQGLEYGSNFRGIKQLWRQDGAALGQIKLLLDLEFYSYHPSLLDACFQVILAAFPTKATSETYLPVAIERVCFYRPLSSNIWSYVKLRPQTEQNQIIADLQLFDEQGIIAQIKGITSKRANPQTLLGQDHQIDQDWFYQIQWQPQPQIPVYKSKEEDIHWLIFADYTGIAQELANFLELQSQSCTLVFPDDLNRQQPQDYLKLLNSLESVTGVIYLWSLDPADSLELSTQSTLYLVQALVKQNYPNRFYLITRGTQAVANHLPNINDLTASPLWGIGKTIALEHPSINCVCIDLDAKNNDIQALCSEISSVSLEDQIAYRDGIRYVARLVRCSLNEKSDINVETGHGASLQISERGTIDHLAWQPKERHSPQFGEVEIRVSATGLNFRDLLNVLGLSSVGELGLECVGEIVAIGDGVRHLKIGDPVIAVATGSFSQYVTVNANLVTKKPELSDFEAATIPGAFLTAYYTLHHLAKLKTGERVLIHAAAGGVGLAAVQIAQYLGAEVFATASDGKWDYLKTKGVKYIMNSRTLEFSDQVMRLTQGKGVDVVLNCLSGEFIPKSLSILSSGGHFLEIGKQGIWQSEQVAQIRPDVSYSSCDLLSLALSKPHLIQKMLKQLLILFDKKHILPLPYQIFSSEQAIDAFRKMQQAKHIGKILITPPSTDAPWCVSTIRSNSTYLITGGLGDLGLKVAQWLITKGASHLILVGRHQPATHVQETITQLTSLGTKIQVIQADVSNARDISQIIQNVKNLRGIIHAAGVLDDGIIENQTWSRFEQVYLPKIQGAWNLHQFSQNHSLDFFVMFSSAASLLGSAGQANYTAANSFLDSLAFARRGLGLPATSINWGRWDGMGKATKNAHLSQGISGMQAIAPSHYLAVLEQLIRSDLTQIGVMSINWSNIQNSPFLSEIKPTAYETITSASVQSVEKNDLMTHVLLQIATVLGLKSIEAIDPDQGLISLGLDSLTSVELRNRLAMTLNCTLPSTIAFDYPTATDLVNYLTVQTRHGVSLQDPPKKTSEEPEITNLQNLTDSEAENLLNEVLENLNY